MAELEFTRTGAAEWSHPLLAVLGSYAVGCVNAAYYLVRCRTGRDIRSFGSGNAGATNAGRLLGKNAFLVTLGLDGVKGALAVGAARWWQLDVWIVAAVALAVVTGHIWPAQLRFRGGRGVATALGALLALDAWMLLVLGGLFLAAFLPGRKFATSGLLAFALCPVAAFVLRMPAWSVAGVSALAVLVLISHRDPLRREWTLPAVGPARGERFPSEEV